MPWRSRKRAAIAACASSSAARKATWWTEPRPIRPGRKPAATWRSTTPPAVGVPPVADDGPLPGDLGKPEDVGEDGGRRLGLADEQAHAGKSSDRVLGRDAAVRKGGLDLGAGDG